MRFQALILFRLALALSSAGGVEVALETVPWTASCYYRTPGGFPEETPRLPTVNSALNGGPISLNGRKYTQGVGGWIGGNMVYRLDGEAERFTARIGIDDSSVPASGSGSPVLPAAEIIVIVNRKIVLQQKIRYGEILPVELDLQGAQLFQVWFRGVHGAPGGFIGIVDAAFDAARPETLVARLRHAAGEFRASLAEKPDYPPAPAWEKVRIEKIRWGEFADAYRISNGKIELVVAPEFGGRIMSFSLPGGKNLLMENRPHCRREMLRQGSSGNFAGGHFMRFRPVHTWLPLDVVLEHAPYSIEFPSEGTVLLRSRPSSWFQLRYEYEITVEPGKRECRVTDRIVNLAPYPQTLSIWSITRLERDGMVRLLLPPVDRRRPAAFELRENDFNVGETGAEFTFGALGGVAEFRYFPVNNRIEYRIFRQDAPEFKIRYDGKGAFPDNGHFPLHVYSAGFCEVESHGAKKRLNPGEYAEYAALWEISNG
ncbi:hypothetical protein SDC9_108408 [bioreactor metagenome]|uniref:Glycosyl hydrolase family 98 putative carbohydrate-binding module domain-containing protein n=1 Tax=bioreactor metagenome TaxID=1076179 RepID=A0A645B922_9ZZZZ